MSERDRIAAVLQERARDCDSGTFRLADDVARYLATPIAEEMYRLRERCLLYNEATTILLECDHGDEAACGCRDRAMERLAGLLPRKEQG